MLLHVHPMLPPYGCKLVGSAVYDQCFTCMSNWLYVQCYDSYHVLDLLVKFCQIVWSLVLLFWVMCFIYLYLNEKYCFFIDCNPIKTQVIYRIKLPGPAILGEGKPENQNHAIIFTRGEGLQTIDMNQVKSMAYLFRLLVCLLPAQH